MSSPSLLIFRFLFSPPDIIRTPFSNFKDIYFFTTPSFHFLSLLVLPTPTRERCLLERGAHQREVLIRERCLLERGAY